MKKIFFLSFLALFSSRSFAVTLDEAFQSALQKNESAKTANEHVVQSQEQLKQAKSTVYPDLSFNATYLVQPKPEDPVARSFFDQEQTTANFTLKQPLFRGFREYAGIRQREDSLAAEQQNKVTAILQLYEAVATSYLNVLALEQDIRNLSEQKKI